MVISHIILAAVWLLYCCLHSLLANEHVKSFVAKRLNISSKTYRIIYNVIALAGLITLIFIQLRIKSQPVMRVTIFTNMLALILSCVGFSIMAICIIKYFGQLSGIIKKRIGQTLEITGIHRYVRHPLYLGTFIFLGGLFFFFPDLSNLLTVLIIIIYTLVGIRFEEAKLIHSFGNQYLHYKEQTPMIIPDFSNKY